MRYQGRQRIGKSDIRTSVTAFLCFHFFRRRNIPLAGVAAAVFYDFLSHGLNMTFSLHLSHLKALLQKVSPFCRDRCSIFRPTEQPQRKAQINLLGSQSPFDFEQLRYPSPVPRKSYKSFSNGTIRFQRKGQKRGEDNG